MSMMAVSKGTYAQHNVSPGVQICVTLPGIASVQTSLFDKAELPGLGICGRKSNEEKPYMALSSTNDAADAE